jgi:GntR family transcriptional regulator/MocR family aminotransferase
MGEPLSLEPLFPDRSTGEALAVQLARRLREAIERGTLPAGTRMLGTRQLAKQLGLGRNTVALAFEELTAQGYFETRTGAGTFVAASLAPQRAHRSVSIATQPTRARDMASLRSYFDLAAGTGPLRPGMPDLTLFPAHAWSGAARRAVDAYDGDLGYGPSNGLRSLREAIAIHVGQFRGVTAAPEQIVVVEGAQAAMHLAALVLSSPRDGVAIEDPCYALARSAFEAYGLTLRPVPVDRDGLIVDELPKDVKFAFVTPTHQFPLGGTLPLSRRLALLSWANRSDAYVLEDDYDSEFTSKHRPLPALQSLDRDERVIYIGSFSKTLAPAVRLGYLIAPPHLAEAFRAARASTSLGASIHVQATAASFIADGHFARHIRRMNAVYDRRRAILLRVLRPLARASFDVGPADMGLHVALVAKTHFDDAAHSSAIEGQRLVALSRLCIARQDCRGFVLGFTNGSDGGIENAARALATYLTA